jgi:hypothetical protein
MLLDPLVAGPNAKRKKIQPTCNNLDFLHLFP